MVTIQQLTEQYRIDKGLDFDQIAELNTAFGFSEDLTDSALKVLVPLLQAYTRLDVENEGVITLNFSELSEPFTNALGSRPNSRLKISLNVPIQVGAVNVI